MELGYRAHDTQKWAYIHKLVEHIKPQAEIISELHLRPTGALELLQRCLDNMAEKPA
jgi:hypothetical protein